MAYLKQTGTKKQAWCISFRWGGVHFTRSCQTNREAVARRMLATVDETLGLLKTGRVEIPAGCDPGDWILSGGRITASRRQRLPNTKRNLAYACEKYLETQVAKAETTMYGEKLHIARLKEILQPETVLSAVNREALQRYANARSRATYRGKPISGTTIRKELMTFRQVWRSAKREGRVSSACPLYDEDGKWQIMLPKPAEGKRFQTWRQIEHQIAIGDLEKKEQGKLWAGLYLDNGQIVELLEFVREAAAHEFIYPMFSFVAYTGCRRSELLRSQLQDLDFEEKQVRLRERKRRKDLSYSTRVVPMHDRLATVLSDWMKQHPGGSRTFAPPLIMPHRNRYSKVDGLTKDQAHSHFKSTLSSSKWNVVSGFHVLRHSFGANLARCGIAERTIGEWMGHSTAEMRSLYQHLFPQDGAAQINALT